MSSLDEASSDSAHTLELSKQPLQGLKLASHTVLEKAQQRGRSKCVKCGGSRMFFCYTCCLLVDVSLQEIPIVKLPVKIDIIKHPNETDGKSTAVHAKILAPSDITIYMYPSIPEYDQDKVVLVFPGPGAVTVQDMIQCLHERTDSRSRGPWVKRRKIENSPAATHSTENLGSGTSDEIKGCESRTHPLQRVVFIDSTWNQTNKISTDERLQDLLQVELRTRKTCFWRSQKGKPETYLATIEAIYYFLKDFHEQCLAQEYIGEYDNLLFFYSYLHTVVNKSKEAGRKQAEERKKQQETERRL
ncbi:tRNA-uridine aminocarboxypropyltransferase 1 [Hippocampus zosterae]|uniref:tRNA-uridine aminocarboxypropyltransferase 1 n=1 Tax=Hippocampus zosterae TaxID=109293 RepID=UPI00223DF084|nr:tRNA-uridine aminocarboxypropyltransferase 1 [Hippocampus zosterae]XP_051919630.1 tRNA-uridine aminocarboxypropyltransferase 1 [Hippocampus zosterae]XP_051919631.1 tRNA-uridine aminocarboxypropyltransferase 1 [Hippocampus zosterae]